MGSWSEVLECWLADVVSSKNLRNMVRSWCEYVGAFDGNDAIRMCNEMLRSCTLIRLAV